MILDSFSTQLVSHLAATPLLPPLIRAQLTYCDPCLEAAKHNDADKEGIITSGEVGHNTVSTSGAGVGSRTHAEIILHGQSQYIDNEDDLNDGMDFHTLQHNIGIGTVRVSTGKRACVYTPLSSPVTDLDMNNGSIDHN